MKKRYLFFLLTFLAVFLFAGFFLFFFAAMLPPFVEPRREKF
jgi:hypothetical protein